MKTPKPKKSKARDRKNRQQGTVAVPDHASALLPASQGASRIDGPVCGPSRGEEHSTQGTNRKTSNMKKREKHDRGMKRRAAAAVAKVDQVAKLVIKRQTVKSTIRRTVEPATLQMQKPVTQRKTTKPVVRQQMSKTAIQQTARANIRQKEKANIKHKAKANMKQKAKTNVKQIANTNTKTTRSKTKQTASRKTRQITELRKENDLLRDEVKKLRIDIIARSEHELQGYQHRFNDHPDETPRNFVTRINSEMELLREQWHLLHDQVKRGQQRFQDYPNETSKSFVSRINSQLESVRQEGRLFHDEVRAMLGGTNISLGNACQQKNKQQQPNQKPDDPVTQEQMRLVQAILESQQAALMGQQQVLKKLSVAGVERTTEKDSSALTDFLSRLENLELNQM